MTKFFGLTNHYVASLAEAWIEILKESAISLYTLVASLAEAWIEISTKRGVRLDWLVASLAEAWIEIEVAGRSDKGTASPPSRRRGLK